MTLTEYTNLLRVKQINLSTIKISLVGKIYILNRFFKCVNCTFVSIKTQLLLRILHYGINWKIW